MARVEILVPVCDGCGAESRDAENPTVDTHTFRVDRRTVKADACNDCFETVQGVLAKFLDAGQRVSKKA